MEPYIKNTETQYTSEEIRKIISDQRDTELPYSTHRRRLVNLQIVPNLQGFYTEANLYLLQTLDVFLRQSGTSIKLFIKIIQQGKNHD